MTDMASDDQLNSAARSNIIKNCFFLWSNLLILILTAIPLINFLVSKFFAKPLWFVPKVYELKLYGLVMGLCVLISMLGRYFPDFFRRNYPKYQFYLLFFYPVAVTLYSLIPFELIRYLSVFSLVLIGAVFFINDLENVHSEQKSFYNKWFNPLLLVSVGVSIATLLYFSSAPIFTIKSSWPWILGVFVSFFLCLRFINLKYGYLIWLLPIFLFVVTFWSMAGTDITHYGFFLGPVIESIYGHFHPLVLDAQYGAGLTTFLTLYFLLKGVISLKNMQLLIKTLSFMEFLLIYFIGVSIYQSRKIAFLALLTVLFYTFYSVNGWSYYMAPSIGSLRLGFIYLILFCYALENKLLSNRNVTILTALLSSIAFIWSFECAIYILPAVFFAEYMNKNLRKFLPIFSIFLVIVISLYLLPFALQGEWPPLSRYYEYAMLYANGFGQISLGYNTSVWWLYPLVYGYVLIRIISGSISNKIIIALTIYGIAIFTYFGGRAHPSNLLNVSIPFVLLSIYLILNLNLRSTFIKQLVLVISMTFFFMVNNVLYTAVEINLIGQKNIPLIKESFLAFLGKNNQMMDYDVNYKTANLTCPADYDPLKKYIENNSIAVISLNDNILINFYACTKSHNALLINTFEETFINPRAVARVLNRGDNFLNHYLLVDASLIDDTSFPPDLNQLINKIQLKRNLNQLINKIQGVKTTEVKINQTTFIVFQSTRAASFAASNQV